MKNSLIALAVLSLPGAAAAQTLPPPTPQITWETHDITDGSPNYGRFASAARTQTTCNGTIGGWPVSYSCPLIGVAHFNASDSNLMYSSSTDGGQTFSTVTVDNRNGDIIGQYAALAFYGDLPVIAYRNATSDSLFFASPTAAGTGNCGGNNWRCRDLGLGGEYNAIAVHTDGRVVIASYDTRRGIYVKEAAFPYTSFTSRDVSYLSARALAVAIDDLAQVHVAWAGSACVRYSSGYFEEAEQVECAETSPVPNTGGIDMVVNEDRRPHLAYSTYSAANGHRIRRAYKSDYQTWHRETVSSLSAAPQAGMSILLTEDGAGTDSIAWGGFSIYGNPRLYVARPGTQTPWSVASGSPTGGAYPSLIRFGTGRAVVHYDAARSRLLFSDDN